MRLQEGYYPVGCKMAHRSGVICKRMKSAFFREIYQLFPNRVVTEQEQNITHRLIELAALPTDEVLSKLNSKESGLTPVEASERLKQFGHNAVAHEKTKPWYIQLLLAFKNPFNLVLMILGTVSVVTNDPVGASIIAVTIVISVTIKFTQEYKSSKSADALKKMVRTFCTVLRMDDNGSSVEMEIPMEELVPGDIVHLAAGDIIPADLRLIYTKTLFISQSALTGESLPIEKHEQVIPQGTVKNALELGNICFMGTNVDVGMATAVVVSTGEKTYFGSMAESLIKVSNPTAFDLGLSSISLLLIRFMAVMVPVVFFITGFTKGNWLDALMFALSVAVGLTPEMLPVVVTSNLAKGAARMVRSKVVVKKLSAIQDFGAMNTLCTDKTGTLTEDRIVLMKHTDVFLDESQKSLEYAYLNSHFESGLKNLMDVAIQNNTVLINKQELEQAWKENDELPFDFERRRMSVILQQGDIRILICKGAVEEMLRCSSFVATPNGDIPITPELIQTIKSNAAILNRDGLRVVAVGHKQFAKNHNDSYTIEEESNLVLDGFMSFLDPPKESAREAIELLSKNGIRVMVLTGDNDVITEKVCREVGLTDSKIILGSDLDELNDEQAIEVIGKHQIFAKLSPMQKARIVKLLRKQGNTVGYMGDGINDAVSLREADIGISVDTAVNIAKESADIILLEKSLEVLNTGVIEGRKMFANIMKYIKATASSNFGNVFSLLGAGALFPFLPMLPIQILILNLLYDISQISIPWDNVDSEYLAKPRKWVATDIKRFMLYIGPTSSVFDYATFAIMFFVFGATTVAQQGLFQTGWFVESLFTQTFILQVLRTEKIPFIQSRPSKQVVLIALCLLVVGLTLPYTGVGHKIGFYPLPLAYYPWLLGVLLCYCTVTQFLKRWYIRRFNNWL